MAREYGNNLVLGTLRGTGQPLVLPATARQTHLYVPGISGTGKSRFLEYLIRQDIFKNRKSGCGLLMIDPHGSLYDRLVAWLVRHNIDRPLILIDMRDTDWVVSYNVLRQRIGANPAVVADNFVEAIAHAWGDAGTDRTPLFARWAGNTLRTLYEQGFTLADAYHLLDPRPVIRAGMTKNLRDPIARRDWELVQGLKPLEFEDKVSSTVNRLRRFVANDFFKCIFGQASASLDLRAAMDEGAIVLVSLATEGGRISHENTRLFGTLLLTDLWTAAKDRGKKESRRPFYVYLDEFQEFLTPTIAANLDQARGFGLHMTLAHQFPYQLINSGPVGARVFDSVMENATSKAVFRLTDLKNLEPITKWLFMGVMNPDEIKHELYSTKVMSYREEERVTHSRSSMSASAFAEHESASDGMSEAWDEDGVLRGMHTTDGFTAGRTHSSQDAFTESESRGSVLIPVMGKELAHVQFRSLEEQVYRAAVTIYDQQQRQFTVRCLGMKAPASLATPLLRDICVRPERLRDFVTKQMERLPFVLPMVEALRRVDVHRKALEDRLLAPSDHTEPTTSRRRVR